MKMTELAAATNNALEDLTAEIRAYRVSHPTPQTLYDLRATQRMLVLAARDAADAAAYLYAIIRATESKLEA